MKFLIVSTALIASTLLGVSPTQAADAHPEAITACLTAHPGAVTSDLVTAGNDTVCVTDYLAPSAGDDTYLWVGADTDADMVLRSGGNFDDPGLDVLSLADWSHAFNESWGFFGIHYVGPTPETISYTAYDDVVGDATACDYLGGSNGVTFKTGLGADLVQCIVGDIQTEGGDDTVIGVTLDATANTGAGNDHVEGDAGADGIVLGGGDDTAYIVGKGVDNVSAGPGADVVRASTNDVVVSATVKIG